MFYLTPVSQERRLPVAGRGAYDSYLEVQGVPEQIEQPATHQLLGARQGRPQLGSEYDPGRINAWITRGVNDGLLCPAALDSGAHAHRTADGHHYSDPAPLGQGPLLVR